LMGFPLPSATFAFGISIVFCLSLVRYCSRQQHAE
jgi:hypothetical protein